METEEQIKKLEKEVENLKRIFQDIEHKLSFHKHYGYDESQMIDGDIKLKPQSRISIGNSLIGHNTLDEGTSSEVNKMAIVAGKGMREDLGPNASDNTELILENQAGTTGSTNQSFFWGFRPPIYVNDGISITSGESTLTDTSNNWTTNILAGAYINVYDSSGNLYTHKIASNTATEITISDTWAFTDANSLYLVLMPVYLGAADYPWRRLYVAEDIRIGIGATAGAKVISIKHGAGSPEGVITARIGSIYLRTDSDAANTTLYVKESEVDNTGWIPK